MHASPHSLWHKLAFANLTFAPLFILGWLLLPWISGRFPFDPLGYLVGRDFVNYWMMGRAALTDDPGRYYDFREYVVHLRAMFGPEFPMHVWSYPPFLFVFTLPFGLLPYVPAAILWTILGYGLFLWAALGRDWRLERVLLIGVAPAVLVNLYGGQNGFFTAALMIGFCRCLDRRPILAGICLGLLAYKPQLAILFPFALLASRRWTAFASAAATVGLWAAVTVGLFGPEPWYDYILQGLPVQTEVMRQTGGIALPMMPTAYMNAMVAGLGPDAAAWVQLPFSLAALAAVLWTFARRRDPTLSMAVLVTATFVVSPYAFNYDMVIIAWVIEQVRRLGTDVAGDRIMAALWTVPVWTVLAGLAGLPLSCLAATAFLIWLVGRLAAEHAVPWGAAKARPWAVSAHTS